MKFKNKPVIAEIKVAWKSNIKKTNTNKRLNIMNFKEPILRVDYKNQVTTELTNNTNTDSEPTSNQNLWVNIEDVMKIAETDK